MWVRGVLFVRSLGVNLGCIQYTYFIEFSCWAKIAVLLPSYSSQKRGKFHCVLFARTSRIGGGGVEVRHVQDIVVIWRNNLDHFTQCGFGILFFAASLSNVHTSSDEL